MITGEFKTAKGWRIFIYIFCLPLLALFTYVGYLAFTSEEFNLAVFLILISVSLGGVLAFIYGLWDTMKGRIVITENSISRITPFSVRTLDLHQIKGFRYDDKSIRIDSVFDNTKPIQISKYTERYGEILDWLQGNFIDLDGFEAGQEQERILNDDRLGIHRQDREYKLEEARRVARFINIIGVVAGLWIWFYPHPYEIAYLMTLFVPLMALTVVFIYRGLIQFDEKKNSPYPSIIYSFLASAGLVIRAILDFEILEYTILWIAVVFATVVMTGAFIIATKELKFRKALDYFTALSMALLVFAYSYGAYVIGNCTFDRSSPEVFTGEVVGKEISTGKVTIYYLTLDPWGPRKEPEKVSVAEDLYKVIEEGDTVDIYLKRGLFMTPWFNVSEH
jgi:hypothetical protein